MKNTTIVTDNREEVRRRSIEALTPEIVAFIETCNQGDHATSNLIGALHRVQHHFGYLGREQLDAVAQLLQVRGRFIINVCLGTACYVKGAERVADRLADELGIAFGETTKDGLFSLESTRCVGTCGLAPVVVIGDKVYGNVTPDQVPGLIEKYVLLAQREDKQARESKA